MRRLLVRHFKNSATRLNREFYKVLRRSKNRKKIPAILLFAGLCFSLLFFFNRGITPYDEGFFLSAADKTSQGNLLYRDFFHFYPPMTTYFMTLSFQLLDHSILSERTSMLIVHVITGALVLSLSLPFFRTKKLLALIPVAVYFAWGPTHINFPWPVMLAISTTVTALWCARKGYEKSSPLLLCVSGFFFSLALLCKQNFGAASLLLMGITMVSHAHLHRKKITFVGSMLFGFLLAQIIFAWYLLQTSSLIPYLSQVWIYPWQHIILEGTFRTPFIDDPNLLRRTMKLPLYLAPLFISSAALIVAHRNGELRNYSAVLSFPLFFYIAGIRPTTDYVHLTPLLSLVGIPVVYLLAKSTGKRALAFWILASAALLIGGYGSALLKGYYRWETSLVSQNVYSDSDRTKIFLDKKYSDVVSTLLSSVPPSTGKKDMLLVYWYAPLFYFLTGHADPIDRVAFSHEGPDEDVAIDTLITKNIPYVVIDIPQERLKQSKIGAYLIRYYTPIASSHEYTIWSKNSDTLSPQL